ncbi:MAG: AAA family ATPase, partial [bacterium]
MPKIKDTLLDSNPWWKDGFKLEFKHRAIYPQIRKHMPYRQIIALSGLRRVGKTTLMLKAAQDAAGEGFGHQNIAYFPFDEFRETKIRDVIQEYEDIFKKNIRDGKHLL